MSRTLSKILVICALVVLIPLTAVGTAFAAYYSVDAIVNITIHTIGQADPGSTDALAAVRYNGEDITKNKFQISQSHMDEITLEARNVGYDFIGWFEGESYTEEMQDQDNLAEGNKLTLKMEDGKSYVAVFQVIKYNLSWHYTVDPDDNLASGTTVSTDPKSGEAGPTEYVYGEELKALSTEKATQYKISTDGGWCLYEGSQANENAHYKRAEFKNERGGDFAKGERDLTLTYNWIGKSMFTVNYYNLADRTNKNKVAIATDKFVKDGASSYVYATKFAELMRDSKVTEAARGYKWEGFKRYDDASSLTDVTSDDFTLDTFIDSVDVYVGSTAVEYTANLSVDAGATYQGQSIKFTVNDVENAQAKFAPFFSEGSYEKDYFFYEFSGIKTDSGNVMAQDKVTELKAALNTFIDANKHEENTLEFTAVFEVEYQLVVSGKVTYRYEEDDPIYLESGSKVEDYQTVAADVTGTLETFLKIGNDQYFDSSLSASRNEVEFTKIAFDGLSITGLSKTTTLAEFIVKLNNDNDLKKYMTIDNATNLITINYPGNFIVDFTLKK